MRIGQKVLALLLLAVVTAALSGATPIPQPGPGHPAGCHGHGQPAPPPVPVSHKCCEAGHQAAIVQEPGNPRDSLANVARISESPRLLVAQNPAETFLSSTALSVKPPGITPLRV